jgi:hypothetical protein
VAAAEGGGEALKKSVAGQAPATAEGERARNLRAAEIGEPGTRLQEAIARQESPAITNLGTGPVTLSAPSGLPTPIVRMRRGPMQRPCLKCGVLFESKGIANRLCAACKQHNTRVNGALCRANFG